MQPKLNYCLIYFKYIFKIISVYLGLSVCVSHLYIYMSIYIYTHITPCPAIQLLGRVWLK